MNDPALPRKRKCPSRYEVGCAATHHPTTPKEYYRHHYFECLDTILTCIRDRFDQPGYRVLKNLEELLLKAARKEDYSSELSFVCGFYKNDLVQSSVGPQLELLGTFFSSYEQKPTLMEIRNYFKSLSPAQRKCMSEILILLKLLMMIPATNAVSERSASAVRRVKGYLRSTMSQVRLNSLLMLHVHKERTDNLTSCLNKIFSGSEHRASVFGVF